MNSICKTLSALSFSLGAVASFAMPTYLTTHNRTDLESNAFVAGRVPSPYPTPPNTTRQLHWNLVRLACYGQTTQGKCPALIKMATNTANPIVLGYVQMDLETGEISPSQISGNGYTLTVVGIAEATLTKD